MKKPTTLMAIDPGARWIGWAQLTLGRKQWTAWHGVLDGQYYPSLVDKVQALTAVPVHARIAESYQLRPVLHQAFKGGQTLRLLGALQYATEEQGIGWHEVMPDNPAKVQKMPIAVALIHFPDAFSKHTLSAWRIMMQWMMLKLPERAMQLQKWAALPDPKIEYRTNQTLTWRCP